MAENRPRQGAPAGTDDVSEATPRMEEEQRKRRFESRVGSRPPPDAARAKDGKGRDGSGDQWIAPLPAPFSGPASVEKTVSMQKPGYNRRATVIGMAPAPHLGGAGVTPDQPAPQAQAPQPPQRVAPAARIDSLDEPTPLDPPRPEERPDLPSPTKDSERTVVVSHVVTEDDPPPMTEPQPLKSTPPQGTPAVQSEPRRNTLAMMRVTPNEPMRTSMVPRNTFSGMLRTVQGGPRPAGMASDAQIDKFRELRTRLLEMAAGLNLHRFTTLVVPITSGSGGSFVARNLATAFTMEGRGASLLVDCNLSRPAQHVALHVPVDTGLFAFLEQPHGQLDRLVHPTGVPGLHLIAAGPARYREYFSSEPMRGLMKMVRHSDYFAFLDGPPVLGSPDARILSELADFVILVVGYGKGTVEEIAEAAQMFDRNKFAGVVFNER